MKIPNFFIIGAPKCGTTSLSEYLADHPNIFMSVPKEPLYFAHDFNSYPGRVGSADAYRDIFSRALPVHRAIGEASTLYLYSSTAVRNIYSFNPNARLIVMLRNPVDFVLSLHAQFLYDFTETEENFAKAWKLQASRADGRNIPVRCPSAWLLQYAEIARFGNQIERVLSIFPRDQVKIILMEDFARSSREVYEEVLTFLEVEQDGRREFPRINERKTHKYKWLGKVLTARPGPVRVLENQVRNALTFFGIRPKKVWTRIVELTTNSAPKPMISQHTLGELIAEFENDIEKLAELIDRDLSHWVGSAKQR